MAVRVHMAMGVLTLTIVLIVVPPLVLLESVAFRGLQVVVVVPLVLVVIKIHAVVPLGLAEPHAMLMPGLDVTQHVIIQMTVELQQEVPETRALLHPPVHQ